MKKLILLSVLIAINVNAQDENKKRPSWSQGLPERQATLQPGNPSFKPADNSEPSKSEPIVSDMGKPELPDIDVGILTEPVVIPEPVLVIESAPVAASPKGRKEALEHYYSSEQQAEEAKQIVINPLVAQYTWKPIKTSPIEIPGHINGSESLKLVIQINPNGKVVSVAKADSNMSSLVLQSAEKSILNWRFEPPSELGITENISKTFTIDVELDA